MPKSPPGVLLLHGFTSVPTSVNIVVPRLEALGVACSVPVLSGHGTSPEDLEGVTYLDWFKDVRQALDELAAEAGQVIVVGQSLGALLALDLAIEVPDKVRGVVSIAAPLRLANPAVYLLPILQAVVPYWHSDPRRSRGDGGYRRFPLRTFAQMYTYSHVVRRKLHRLTRPLLIMQSTMDCSVRPRSANALYDEVSSQDKELVWFHHSHHALLCEAEKDEAADRVVGFVQRLMREDAVIDPSLSSLRLN